MNTKSQQELLHQIAQLELRIEELEQTLAHWALTLTKLTHELNFEKHILSNPLPESDQIP